MRYTYRSRVGLMEIVPIRGGHWQLIIDGEEMSTYPNPEGAAEDVSGQMTGHNGWDNGSRPSQPKTLADWQQAS